MKKRTARNTPLFEVRHSRVHGCGVFALRKIRKGTNIVEYIGDRVTHEEANTRYADKDPVDGHTFLFTVDDKTVIDAGVNGNEARYVNHGCDPNCQTVDMGKRIFIEALRTIRPGEELAYDYRIARDADDPANIDEIFACHCGAARCRGTMLERRKKKSRPPSASARTSASQRRSASKRRSASQRRSARTRQQ